MTISDWLARPGMGQYTDAFERNDVDLEVLPRLTEHDLERLGVFLGHRKKMLKAIDESQRGVAPASAAPVVEPAPPAPGIESTTAQGEPRQVTVLFCDLVELNDRTGNRMYEADIHPVTGLLHEKRSSSDLAQAAFLRSIEVANSQSAKGFELRSATSLARLWQAQAKRREAYDLLAPVYDWFTEGHDTRDLKEAAALLRELQ